VRRIPFTTQDIRKRRHVSSLVRRATDDAGHERDLLDLRQRFRIVAVAEHSRLGAVRLQGVRGQLVTLPDQPGVLRAAKVFRHRAQVLSEFAVVAREQRDARAIAVERADYERMIEPFHLEQAVVETDRGAVQLAERRFGERQLLDR